MDMAGIRVAVVGGDRRMAAAALALAERGAWVRTAHVLPLPGGGPEVRHGRVTVCSAAREALAGAQAVLLPAQVLADDERIHTEEPGPPVHLRPDDWERVAPGAVVFAGKVSPRVAQAIRGQGLILIEYRDRDDFALYNSVPSAEGAIALAMAASPVCLFGSASLVVGYGRCGATLAQMLRGIGAHVTVATRRQSELARAWAGGHTPLPLDRLSTGVAASDLIFNTIPALVLTREVLAVAPRHAAIVDLASDPGGCDFAAAKELGIRAQIAPGLPGKVAPVTAGRIVADLVARYLAEQTPPGLGVAREVRQHDSASG